MSRRRTVSVRRVYEGPQEDGYRALVDRLWPRGMTRTPDLFDGWAKDAAPSTELRRWYGHDPAKYAEFARRYRSELHQPPASEAVARLASVADRQALVLLTATRDVEHSGAHVLAAVLQRIQR